MFLDYYRTSCNKKSHTNRFLTLQLDSVADHTSYSNSHLKDSSKVTFLLHPFSNSFSNLQKLLNSAHSEKVSLLQSTPS